MVCIYCGSSTDVINSRPQKRLNRVWRRRLCSNCQAKFTTIELPELSQSVMVNSNTSGSSLRPFQPENLLISLYESCRHRPTAIQDAAALADTVIANLLAKASAGVITTGQIKQAVLSSLNHFDNTAAVYYQAYFAS